MSIVSRALFLDKIAVKADITAIAQDIRKMYGTTSSPEAQQALLKAYNTANNILRAKRLPKGWDVVERRYPKKAATMMLNRNPGVTSQEVAAAAEAWYKRARSNVYRSFPWYKTYANKVVEYEATTPYVPKPVFNVTPTNYTAWKLAKRSAKDPNAEEFAIKMAETNFGKKPLDQQLTLFDLLAGS